MLIHIPYVDPEITLSVNSVKRILGIEIPAPQIAEILQRLGFTCQVQADGVVVKSPPHRVDIGTGVVGEADLIEEIARLVGYDTLPATALKEEMPPVHDDRTILLEDTIRDLLVDFGLQEIITYRFTSPEHEKRIIPAGSLQMSRSIFVCKTPSRPIAVLCGAVSLRLFWK